MKHILIYFHNIYNIISYNGHRNDVTCLNTFEKTNSIMDTGERSTFGASN